MKTIFFGNNKITFSNKIEVGCQNVLINPHISELRIISNDLLTRENYEFWIIGNVSKNFNNFKKLFFNIDAAGGAVLNKSNQVLIIKRLNKWDLPKGKKENDETPANCAVREVEEECGISNPRILKKLMPTYHIYNLNNLMILKTTYWFLMKYKGNELLNPQQSEDITEAKWVDLAKFNVNKNDTYPNIIGVLSQIKFVGE